jgi:hypothetical protein
MGTRCLTHVVSHGVVVLTLYRQMDGYPTGHGKDLKDLWACSEETNGLSSRNIRTFNGMGCLAAQTVAYFKTEPGQFYLYPPGCSDVDEEWVYRLTSAGTGKEPCLTVETPDGKILWQGTISKFNPEYVENLD